jgi:hypothetical protein
MNATAFGLMVAVPALLMHGFLLSKAERILERVEEISISIARAIAHGSREVPDHSRALSGSYGSPAYASAGRPSASSGSPAPAFVHDDPQSSADNF